MGKKMNLTELAGKGAQKLKKALEKFFNDSQIINEIYDKIDKELFFPATAEESYRHIEDIKESDIFDQFIELCFGNASLGIDIPKFVENYYAEKSDDAKKYVVAFFENIAQIIFEVLKDHASFETKLLLKGQEISLNTILKRFDSVEKLLCQDACENVAVVTYSANMQGKNWSLINSIPNSQYKNVTNRIDLSMKNFPLMPCKDDSFWEIEKQSLIATFNKYLIPLLEDGYAIDLYALAPIPLLVQLGNLFANRPNINIFQLKKVPSTFEWDKIGDKLNIRTENLIEDYIKEVALSLSFSGKIDKNNILTITGNKIPLIEMSIDEPFDDFLRTKEQFNEFLLEFRKLKSFLTSKGVQKIHLFAAIPVAFAIGIGQAYNPNYDANIITYDYKQGMYIKAITIGGKDE